MTLLFWIVGALWLLGAAALWRSAGKLPPLPPSSVPPEDLPTVSIIIAARDEAARIERSVRSLLLQTVRLAEIIVVDDRSTDDTSVILARLAASDPRLKVVSLAELPPGWLGKMNALWQGVQHSTGDWILFTDADVEMDPATIARALAAGLAAKAEHVCAVPRLTPRNRRVSAFGHACGLVFLLSLVKHVVRVNDDLRTGFAGVGAFNLISRRAYFAFGGHESLKLEIADDPMLGLLHRRQAGRSRCYAAAAEIDCDWGGEPLDVMRRLEKNHFAMMRFRLGLALVAFFIMAMLWTVAVLGPFTGAPAGIFAGVGLLAMMLPAARLADRLGLPLAPALLVPLAFPILGFAMLNSIYRTLRQGGVRWRDTFYPLDELRRGATEWSPFERLPPPRDPPANAP